DPAAAAPCPEGGPRRATAQRDRCLRALADGTARSVAIAGSRPPHPRSATLVRPGWPAAVAGRGRRLRQGPLAAGLRKLRRPAPRVETLRRTPGNLLARRGA